MSAKLLILAVALAVLANARVTLLPGWAVPAPAVFLAITLAAAGVMAAAVVARARANQFRPPVRPELPAPAAKAAS